MGNDTAPDYGVRTCGKLAEEPFDKLGPCIRTPDHDGRCRFRAPVLEGATVEVERVDRKDPFDADPLISKYRRQLRTASRISLACTAGLILLFVYQLLHAFEVL